VEVRKEQKVENEKESLNIREDRLTAVGVQRKHRAKAIVRVRKKSTQPTKQRKAKRRGETRKEEETTEKW